MVDSPHHHHRFPEKWAFLLNSPIRRWLDPPEKLISKLEIGPRDTVMDFGCGPGFMAVPLAKVVGRVIAVDVSPLMLERAEQYARKQRVSIALIQSDGSKIDIDTESVDLILLNHVFHEVEKRRATLGEFSRVLKTSGRIAIVERTRSGRFSVGFGPPIIDAREVMDELTDSGFKSVGVISHGRDSIIIGEK